MTPTWKRRAALGALVVALAVGSFLLLFAPVAAPPRPDAGAASDPSVAAGPTAPASASPAPPAGRPTPPTAAEGPPEAPVIDEIVLEKQEVCAGEENLITVRAHTPRGADDAYLHYAVAGETGVAVPFVAYQGYDSEPAPIAVAFGRDNVSSAREVPRFRVKACKQPRQVLLSFRGIPNDPDGIELLARVRNFGATRPFKPVTYRWSFGDGTSEETRSNLVEHGYAGRSQDTLVSHFLVRCEVTGEDGEKVVGRRSVPLWNSSFENLRYKGVVLLHASLSPRFPVLSPTGVVEQRVRLWHARPGPVRITRVQVLRNRASTIEREEARPERLWGKSEIAPGAGLEVALRLDTRATPDLHSIDYEIEGQSDEGHPARGRFSIMRPSPDPTRASSAPVNDPVMVAKILRARELLKQEFVTDEDLWRLEREGKLADLGVAHPDGGVPPATPRKMPK